MAGVAEESSHESITRVTEERVDKVVKSIVRKLRRAPSQKWNDPDFGPDDVDNLGAKSLYKNGNPPSAGYPSASSLRWERPVYAPANDGGNEKTASWCTNGVLFKKNSNSVDIVQGKLGDCWLLGAFSMLAQRRDLLHRCFWKLDAFKEYGIFVCRITKGFVTHYVIIDDRLPVFDCINGQLCFARCGDPNELWVPLLEKAYAKLHQSYDALIGGSVDEALRDLSGLTCEAAPISRSMAQSKALWNTMQEYLESASILGCSYSLEDGSANSTHQGLLMRHVYTVVGLGAVNGVQLVRMRNPWLVGDWEGRWGNRSVERGRHANELESLWI